METNALNNLCIEEIEDKKWNTHQIDWRQNNDQIQLFDAYLCCVFEQPKEAKRIFLSAKRKVKRQLINIEMKLKMYANRVSQVEMNSIVSKNKKWVLYFPLFFIMCFVFTSSLLWSFKSRSRFVVVAVVAAECRMKNYRRWISADANATTINFCRAQSHRWFFAFVFFNKRKMCSQMRWSLIAFVN